MTRKLHQILQCLRDRQRFQWKAAKPKRDNQGHLGMRAGEGAVCTPSEVGRVTMIARKLLMDDVVSIIKVCSVDSSRLGGGRPNALKKTRICVGMTKAFRVEMRRLQEAMESMDEMKTYYTHLVDWEPDTSRKIRNKSMRPIYQMKKEMHTMP